MFYGLLDVYKKKWYQIWIASIVSASSISSGMSLGWTSPVLEELHGPNSPLSREPTLDEEGWIGSLAMLGGIVGPLLVIPLWRYIGRRWIFICSNIPLLLGWVLAGAASDIPTIYAARLMWGVTIGIHFAIVPIYVGEIAEAEIRGALAVLFSLFTNIGYLMTYAIGPATTYWGLAITGGVVTLVYLPLSWFIPETPFYLVYKGRTEEASTILQRLRQDTQEAVQPELDALQDLVVNEFKHPPKISDLWASRETLKATGMCVFLTMLQQFSGMTAILFYLQGLLRKLETDLSAVHGTIVVGVVQVVGSLATPLVVDRLGRKLLLWTTSLGMAIVLAIIGVYELLDAFQYDLRVVAFLPLLCLVVFVICFMLGVGPVPWVLVSEMFPVKTKSIVSGICSFMLFLAGFIWTRYFNDVVFSYGLYSGFWILSTCCLIGAVFAGVLLPETKGKTFQEIQELLRRKHKSRADHPTYLGGYKDPKKHYHDKFAF